jgi:hypothetical protein
MKITLPIRGSEFEEDSECYELFLKEIEELSNHPILIELIDSKDVPRRNERKLIEQISFQIVEGNRYYNSEPKFATKLNKKHSFFHTEWISEYLIIDLKLKEDNLYNEKNEDNHCEFIVNDFLNRLNFLINLSYSTTVDFLTGVIYSNSSKFLGKTKIILNSNMYAYEHSRKMNWPKIKNVKLIDTINWFKKFNLHPNNRSENNLHRAINAFSQLFGGLHNNHSADLFWIMLGIEALLVEGNQNITSQFKEKSIIIFGKPLEYSKKLTKLYEYRSKLVHGSFDIYPIFYSDYDAFDKEYYDYLEFATSILIALIRELIAKQSAYFEFEFKLKS